MRDPLNYGAIELQSRVGTMGAMNSNDSGSNNVDISVLGSVAVRRDGDDVDLGPQLRRVLAALVSRHDSVVSVDRLVESVWLGEPPAGADGSIKTYITRLRKVLDPDREGLLTYRSPGYVFALGEHTLDSADFDVELDEGVRRLRSADYEGTVEVLTDALGRWRGDAYAGYAEEDWARPEATRLEERRIEATELPDRSPTRRRRHRAGRVRRNGAHGSRTTSRTTAELLMRGLYSAGRQADALREFRSFRNLLVEEAGLDPSEDLVELEGRIVRSGSLPCRARFEHCGATRSAPESDRAPSPSCTALCSRASSARSRSRSSARSWPTVPSSCAASSRKHAVSPPSSTPTSCRCTTTGDGRALRTW